MSLAQLKETTITVNEMTVLGLMITRPKLKPLYHAVFMVSIVIYPEVDMKADFNYQNPKALCFDII